MWRMFQNFELNKKRITYWILVGSIAIAIAFLTRREEAFDGATINSAFQELLGRLSTKTESVSSFWSAEQSALAKLWLVLDCAFALLYTTFFSLLCGSLSQSLQGFLAVVGRILARFVWIGAIVDLGENAILWSTLQGEPSQTFVQLASWLGWAKWIMPTLSIFYVVVWLGYRIRKRRVAQS